MPPVPHPRVQFGSSQKGKLVPLHFAADRPGTRTLRPDAPGLRTETLSSRPPPEDRRPIRVPPQGKPFNSTTPRFTSSTVEPSPGNTKCTPQEETVTHPLRLAGSEWYTFLPCSAMVGACCGPP
ncbi:hypothetical protein EYF80_024533 [Liparis tanakae]|uniref:Uncharacterized protein n=1 Tax=Liparis tanakae TaxID=230148 RepID=A0A4Z2HK00_9TELE|nr:hypothetical protein EYF80_024533 [Liparis tanakae]